MSVGQFASHSFAGSAGQDCSALAECVTLRGIV